MDFRGEAAARAAERLPVLPPLTLDPVTAIEVDDRSHLLPERQQRDAFVNAVFLEIGLPLMRVKARRAYSVDELRAMCARAGLFTLPPRMEGANS